MFRTTLRSTILRASFLLLATLVFACSSDGNKETAEGAAGGGSDAAPAAQIPTGHFVGPVTETMDAGGYTYVKLEKNGESIWAAGPETKVAVGDEVFVELAMPMPQFESPALGRKFDVLYFVGGFGTPEQAGSRPGARQAEPLP